MPDAPRGSATPRPPTRASAQLRAAGIRALAASFSRSHKPAVAAAGAAAASVPGINLLGLFGLNASGAKGAAVANLCANAHSKARRPPLSLMLRAARRLSEKGKAWNYLGGKER